MTRRAGRQRSTAARTSALLAILLGLSAGCGSEGGSGSPSSGQPPSASAAATPTDDANTLRLLALGDSIPFNSPDDCPRCTGFVTQYADALSKAAGQPVEPNNLSDHTGLTLPRLLADLDSFSGELARADAIVVGIAHNSFELSADAPCGTTYDEATNTLSDWSKVDEACATNSAASYRDQYDELFSTIAQKRASQPTILIALNKYSDWLGWEDAKLTPDQERRTVMMHDAWNTMLCDSAEANGFTCADVYHAFNGPSGDTPSGDLLAGDYTHPSQAGNDRIAQVLEEIGFAPLA